MNIPDQSKEGAVLPPAIRERLIKHWETVGRLAYEMAADAELMPDEVLLSRISRLRSFLALIRLDVVN